MDRKFWLVPLAGLGAALLYRNLRRGVFRQIAANVTAFDLPTAGLYDALFASQLDGFYSLVSHEVAASCPTGLILEVGSGPGRLAVRLSQAAPSLTLIVLDISSDMVKRATSRVTQAGLADRVRFEEGDVAALPFPDRHFDGVVSTLALHHWADPARGLAEIFRVLKPSGEAWIYDLAGWLWGAARSEDDLAALVAMTPFGNGTIEAFRWPGPVPAFTRLRLRRVGETDSRSREAQAR